MPTVTRQDPQINFDWGTNSPAAGVSTDHFSVRWTKQQYFPAGKYTFTTGSDDGSRLYIDNTLLINKWNDQAFTQTTGTIDLTDGNHTIRYEYYDNFGNATVLLDWQFVAPTVITPTPTPVTGQKLGGMDLNGYCNSINAGNTASPSGNNWVCTGNGQVITMTTACQWQYKTQNAVAQQDTAGDPYSWSCYASTTGTPTSTPTPTVALPTPTPGAGQKLGGLNLNGYCGSIGAGTNASLSNNNWICTQSGQTIDMTQACQWQYNTVNTTAKQDTTGNPYTWSCYSSTPVIPTPTPTGALPTPTPQPNTGYSAKFWNLPTNTAFPPAVPTTTPTLSRTDQTINFDWGLGSPDATINPDNFIAQWSKTQTLDAGTYTFTASADNGVRVYLDGTIIIDKWIDQPTTTYSVAKTVTAGSHTVRVEYYEHLEGAVAQFNFQKN